MARAAGNADGPGLQKADRVYTASFNSLATRKATFLLALILIGSPVAGLRPMRAARFRTWSTPRPLILIRSPFFRCLATRSTMSVSTASACFLANSWFSASCAARCFRVTVACGAAALGDFAAVLATAAAFLIAMADRLAGCRFSCIETESRFLPEDKLFLQFHVPAWGTFHRWGVWH